MSDCHKIQAMDVLLTQEWTLTATPLQSAAGSGSGSGFPQQHGQVHAKVRGGWQREEGGNEWTNATATSSPDICIHAISIFPIAS